MKKVKLINFGSEELSKQIQEYANKNHNGNFNQAVRDLISFSLRTLGEDDE